MKQAVIFAGAPVQPELQPPVPQADLYLCADAGVRLAQALGIVPDRIMGDFDSLGDVPAGENVEAFSPEKDDTDILLAAKYALSAGCSRLIFYGALGGRLDHMVANLQMLRFLADRNAQGILVDYAHWITLQRGGTASYPRREGMYFSLFAMTERCEDVMLEGVAYPLCHGVFSNAFPLGVSNEILAETAKVTVGKGSRILKQSGKADSKADAERKIKAAVAKANHGKTKLSATIVGNASLVASQCVQVVGLGKLSGKYYIDTITHNVSGSGGYTMDLEMSLVEE